MALTIDSFILTVSILGERGAVRTKTFEIERDPAAVDDAAAIATARSNGAAFIAAFADLTSGVITDYQFSVKYVEDGAVSVPADADIYTEGVYTVGLNTAQTKKGTITVPAPKPAIYVGGNEAGGALDNSNADLLTVLDFYTGNGWIRLSDGERILSTPPVLASRLRSVSSGKRY